MQDKNTVDVEVTNNNRSVGTTQLSGWFHEGQTYSVVAGELCLMVRFVGRKGRRARICITAPAGAVFIAE